MNSISAHQLIINVKVTPNAARNEILGMANDVWRIKIAAPPDKGKANKELTEFLSQRLDIRKGDLVILKGLTSHTKKIAIGGLTREEVIQRLSSHE